jgi:hypothetical protein
VLYLPKHVESCFFAGSTTTADNFCTINYEPSAAYCAYHSQAGSNAVYANMPYPIYQSPVGFTCGTEKNFGVIESPNGNPDADVEISPTSHEINEAITDPDTVTGWYDSSGFERGARCARRHTTGSVRGSGRGLPRSRPAPPHDRAAPDAAGQAGGLLSRQQRTKSRTTGLASLAGDQATPTRLGLTPVTGR